MKRTSMRRVVVAVVGLCVVAGWVPAQGQEVAARVFACGENTMGQLGDGTTDNRAVPVSVSGLSGVTRISVGNAGNTRHAIKADGSVWAWGANYTGEIGDGTVDNANWPYGKTVPVAVAGLASFTAIAEGGYGFALGLKNDGTVWAWGDNRYGQIGIGAADSNPHPTPEQVLNLSDVIAIAAGHRHAVALKRNGSVWTWGMATGTGHGDSTIPAPTEVTGLTGVTVIAAGGFHTVVKKNDGTIWACGAAPTVGDGTAIHRYTFVQCVSLPTTITQLAGGGTHTLALDSDGSVWSWGRNDSYQAGDETTTEPRLTPAPVSGIANVAAIAAGRKHSAVLKSDGSVWSWGDNTYGQIGEGTFGGVRSAPVRMQGDLLAVNSIKCGYYYTVLLAGSQVGSIVTDPQLVAVPEGGTASFQAKLAMRPAGDVLVTVARVSGDADISVQAGASLTFTPANWDTWQSVTLAAAADGDSGIAAILLSAPGMLYSLVNAIDVLGGAPSDADGDGMLDTWESTYLGGVSASPTADADADGMNNLQEYMAGTNPTNASSVLAVVGLTGSGSTLDLKWLSADGKKYEIQKSTNLMSGFTATEASGIDADAPTNTYSVPVGASGSGFYRVRLE